jgi:hypothetical protein
VEGSRLRVTLLAGALWAATLVCAGAAARYASSVVATPHDARGEPLAAQLGFLVVYLTLATVGGVVARQRPRHPIGWLFLGSAWMLAASELGHGYAHHAVLTGATDTALAQWGGLAGAVLFLPPFVLLTMYLPLIFPDGRLLTPRWRIVVGFLVVAVAVLVLVELLRPGPLWAFAEIDNPLGVRGAGPLVARAAAAVDPLFFPIVAAIGVAVVQRFRRATATERQQFKWVALPAGALLVFLPLNELWLREADGAVAIARDVFFFAAFAGLPVGLAIAVLRFRLYDIDRILSRTVTYAALSLVLVGVYAGGVVTLGAVLRTLTASASGDLVVAASTLAVAALFQPARRRIKRTVDRRFNRNHYDATRTIERFGQRLRNELDPDTLLSEIRDVVATSVQPSTTTVWTPSPPEHGPPPA